MKFQTEDSKSTVKINKASKSALNEYQKCPLKAAKKIRDTRYRTIESKQLDIGILAHEIAEMKLQQLQGKTFNIQKIEERFPLDVIYEIQNDIFKRINFERLFKDQTIIEIEESFSIDMPQVSENFKLISKPDAMAYREINNSPYIAIYEWKSGFVMSTEVDTEALVYAYAAFKKYGLPVILTRVNLRTGKIWSEEFSIQSILDIEPMLISLMKRYKKDMEDDILPEFEPGSHCQYCPFITECEGRKYVSTLRQKYKAAIWAKELAKKYEAEVKAAAKEVLSTVTPNSNELDDNGTSVLLPFLNDKFGAVAETSTSFQLATKKIKKRDVIKVLSDSGYLDTIIDSIDIKFNEEIATLLSENFDIPMKEVVRTTVKLKEKKD